MRVPPLLRGTGDRHPWGRTWLAAGLLVLAACGPSEGTTRPLEVHWQGPDSEVRCRGTERREDGTWVKHGDFVFYDQEGRETHRGRYAHGLETGLWRELQEDGTTGQGEYHEGRRSGHWTWFHPGGRVAEKGVYVDGLREGPWERFDEDGEALGVRVYRGGKLVP